MTSKKMEEIGKTSLLRIIWKVLFYNCALAAILWIDGIYELATHVSAISMFVVVSASYELLMEKHLLKGFKYVLYIVCIIGFLIGGMSLVKQANHVKSCQHNLKSI